MKKVNLPGNQEKIDVAKPKGKITAADFKALRAKKDMKEGGDHEVSMANNSLDTIIKNAMALKAKLGNEEKDIPAWIQDHITNAANFISQAAENYHEYNGKIEDIPVNGALEDSPLSLAKMMEDLFETKK